MLLDLNVDELLEILIQILNPNLMKIKNMMINLIILIFIVLHIVTAVKISLSL